MTTSKLSSDIQNNKINIEKSVYGINELMISAIPHIGYYNNAANLTFNGSGNIGTTSGWGTIIVKVPKDMEISISGFKSIGGVYSVWLNSNDLTDINSLAWNSSENNGTHLCVTEYLAIGDNNTAEYFPTMSVVCNYNAYTIKYIEDKTKSIDKIDGMLAGSNTIEDLLTNCTLVNKSYKNTDWKDVWNAGNRISNVGYEIKVVYFSKIICSVDDGYIINKSFYNKDKNILNSLSGDAVPDSALYMRIVVRKNDDSNLTSDDVKQHCSISGIYHKNLISDERIIIESIKKFNIFDLKTELLSTTYQLVFGNITNSGATIAFGGNNRILYNKNIPIYDIDIKRIEISSTNGINAYVYFYDMNNHIKLYNIQQNVGENKENYWEILFPHWSLDFKPTHFNICFRNSDNTAITIQEILDNIEIKIYTKNINRDTVKSASQYWKDWLFDRLDHAYYTANSLIEAHYLGFATPISVPISMKLSFPTAKYNWIVRYYDYIEDQNQTVECGNSGWNSNNKEIMPNSAVVISIQYPNGTDQGTKHIPWSQLYDEMKVEIEPQICQITRDQFLPYPLSNNYTDEKRLCLMHFSDNHNNSNIVTEMAQYYHWFSNYITDCICTGDIVNDDSTDDFTFWANAGASDILTCIGNHDAKHTENGSVTFLTETEKYSMYFAPFIDDWGVNYSANKTWYHKIYSDEGIILLVYDSMITSNNSEEMYEYIQNVLNFALNNDYSVIMAEHFSMADENGIKIECAFTGIGGLYDNLIAKTYSIKDRTHELVKHFTDNGGDFICFLTGHLHSNILSYHKDYKQLNISIASAGYGQGVQSNSSIRQNYTKSRFEFNLIYPCRHAHTLTIQRIGANKDRLCRTIDNITINYKTMQIINQ